MSSRASSGASVAIAVLVVGLSVSSCEGDVVNLGRKRVASATGGADAGGSNSGGQPSETAGLGNAGTTANGGQPSAGRSGSASTQAGTSSLEPRFTNVQRVPSLASIYEDDNPTLTADLKELYFSSKNRPDGVGNVDVWVAKRDSIQSDFSGPTPVLTVSTVGIDNSPAISADGLTIWVGFAPATDGLGGYDIMRATRASREDDFGTPVIVKELSSPKDDIPRPLGYHDLIMPLASRRDNELYMTYFATRPSTTSSFGTPVFRGELVVEGANVSDAWLSEDGLVLYFARAVNSRSDLFVARRTNLNSPFGTAVPLTTLNTEFDDRDPWLAPDGRHIYFSSDRDSPGTLNIYEADLVTD